MFVEPTHKLHIAADVDPADLPSDYGNGNRHTEQEVPNAAANRP